MLRCRRAARSEARRQIRRSAGRAVAEHAAAAARLEARSSQDAYDQDVSKGGYESQVHVDKDLQPDYAHRLIANLIGDPEFLAPKSLGEYAKDEAAGAAGFGSGVLQAGLGLAEGIPGGVGQGAAEANKLLKGVGDPSAQTFGNVAAQLVPIGAGAEAAGSVAKSAIEEGPKLARWGEGVVKGALGGTSRGLMTPTGETDADKRA